MIDKLFKEYNEVKTRIAEEFSLEYSLGLDIEYEEKAWCLSQGNLFYLGTVQNESVAYGLDNVGIWESKDGNYKLVSGDDGCGGKCAIILISNKEITDKDEIETFQETYC